MHEHMSKEIWQNDYTATMPKTFVTASTFALIRI